MVFKRSTVTEISIVCFDSVRTVVNEEDTQISVIIFDYVRARKEITCYKCQLIILMINIADWEFWF